MNVTASQNLSPAVPRAKNVTHALSPLSASHRLFSVAGTSHSRTAAPGPLWPLKLMKLMKIQKWTLWLHALATFQLLHRRGSPGATTQEHFSSAEDTVGHAGQKPGPVLPPALPPRPASPGDRPAALCEIGTLGHMPCLSPPPVFIHSLLPPSQTCAFLSHLCGTLTSHEGRWCWVAASPLCPGQPSC